MVFKKLFKLHNKETSQLEMGKWISHSKEDVQMAEK
jgi:hypothetical protein